MLVLAWAFGGVAAAAVAGASLWRWGRSYGSRPGQQDRRQPAHDDPEEMLERRKDDDVGGED